MRYAFDVTRQHKVSASGAYAMEKLKIYFIGVLFIAATTAGLVSAEPMYSNAYTDCVKGSDDISSRVIDCITAETKRQDSRLNANYRQAMAALTEQRRSNLRDAQRVWIQYRDANCKAYSDPDGGTQAWLAATQCFMSMTAERADELRYFMQFD